MGWATMGSEFESPVVLRISTFPYPPDPFWGSTQPPIQWVPGVMRQVREADHSQTTSAKVKKKVDLYIHSPIHLHICT
jgi:hypothetical protein